MREQANELLVNGGSVDAMCQAVNERVMYAVMTAPGGSCRIVDRQNWTAVADAISAGGYAGTILQRNIDVVIGGESNGN